MKYIEMSKELGKLIADSKEYIRLHEAEKKYNKDVKAKELLAKFREKQKMFSINLQHNANTDKTKSRSELSRLFIEIEQNETITELNTALNEFLILKQNIYNNIEAYINIDDEILSVGNSGGCNKGCGGCK